MSFDETNRPLPEYLLPMAEALQKAKAGTVSDPWRKIASLPVEGLEAVGFQRDNENLVVINADSQVLINCTTGEVINHYDNLDGFDYQSLRTHLPDQNDNKPIEICGLYGGGLRVVTSDGWTAIQIPMNWPQCYFLLEPPGSTIYNIKIGEDPIFDLVSEDYEASAYGFSWTGKTLVKATSASLDIWGRDTVEPSL